MDINFILPGFYKSGGIRVIFEYANRLTAKGHKVKAYVPLKTYNNFLGEFRPVYTSKLLLKDLIYKNKKKIEPFMNIDFDLIKVNSIKNKYIEDADIVIATGWQTAYSVNNLSRQKGRKVYLIQGYEVWDANVKSVENTYQFPFNRITISQYLHDLLKNRYNSDSTVISNGIDFHRFNISKKDYGKKITISFIVSRINIKNLAGAVAAVKKIHDEYNDIRIECFGVQESELIPDYAEYFFNPSDEKIVEIYCNSDIFVYSSLYEGFGLPPAEAMACKAAVVTNKVGAVPEYSKHLYSAYHCNPDNPDELYKGIKYLIDNKDERIRISENGFNDVKKSLNWDISTTKFENYLLEIIKENG
jgi:glycosyltransferase involved in cell wall biosynthesis